MCGIAGVARFDGQPVDAALVQAMTSRLAHRGPDAEGTWVAGAVGFGHRRLSVIDPDGSPQPMASPDGRLHVTFNGEILNYAELRKDLDYPWRWRGDTEVLLAAYEARGVESVSLLRGQFAYALHDDAQGCLWLVRDRLGILPLYYFVDSRMIAFASEVPALLPALPGRLDVDESGLAGYLAYRSVPAPGTLFRGIRKVPPGHWLRVGRDGDVRVERYWEVPRGPASFALGDREAIDMVADGIDDAVRESLVADAPVGALLSGGVDSSLLVARAAAHSGGSQMHTFSAVFGDERNDEGPYAADVSRAFGTRHHEVHVTPDDFASRFHHLTFLRGAPMSDPADMAVNLLARRARDEVKVLLSGEGSDELFAGYPKYRMAGPTATTLVPTRARRALLESLESRLPVQAKRLRIAARALAEPTQSDRMLGWFAPFTGAERVRLLGALGVREPESFWGRSRGDAMQRMQHADCHAWLSDNLLERGDRMTMAASVEMRPPYLDHRLVELAFSLPSRMKVRRGETKWVLRQVAARSLPPRIVKRPKVGFRVPIDAWFRGGLRDLAHDLLLAPSSFAAAVMDPGAVRELLRRHAGGRANEDARIWTLLSLEVWHQVFFRSESIVESARPLTRPATAI